VETDVVNVVEWSSQDNERYFLLVRRPDTGLLAGLHEFPTRADVEESSTKLKVLAQDVLQELFANPPPPYRATLQMAKKVVSPCLVVRKIQLAGDVPHVFSHIKKTYRVQWILLEGGEGPPALNVDYIFVPSTKPKPAKAKKAKLDASLEEKSMSKSKEPTVRWVKYDDVETANVGTGVMKVWKKVCSLWQN